MNKLKELRKAKGLTQSFIADRFHIYQYRVSRIENGMEELKLDEAVRLAKFFKVTIDYLLNIRHPDDDLQGMTQKECGIIKALRVIPPEDREYIEGLIEGFILRR